MASRKSLLGLRWPWSTTGSPAARRRKMPRGLMLVPDATLYTLIHRRGSLSPTIESMKIRTSAAQKVPGVFAGIGTCCRSCPWPARLALPRRRGPRDPATSHCRQGGHCPDPESRICCTSRRCAYAWLAGILIWRAGPTDRWRLLARQLTIAVQAGSPTASRVSPLRRDLETVRRRIARCYRRDGRVIQPPVDVEFLHSRG